MATRLPPVSVAAHQPVWQTWNLAAFMHTPLEAAALAFLPAARGGRSRRSTAGVLLRLTAWLGLATAAATAAVAAWGPRAFTPDVALHPLMRAVAPQAAAATLACAFDVAATGLLVAHRRLAPLVASMACALGATLAWRAAACGAAPTAANAGGLAPVWWALVVFFVARAVGSCGTLWWYELGPLAVARGRSGAALGLGAAAT